MRRERLPEELSPLNQVLPQKFHSKPVVMDIARSFPALPELVLLCSWRKDRRKAKLSSRVQTAMGLGISGLCKARPPSPQHEPPGEKSQTTGGF